MKNPEYRPVACSFYDSLEEMATFRKKGMIQYLDEAGNTSDTVARINDLKTVHKEEFVILSNSLVIRLDRIMTIKQVD